MKGIKRGGDVMSDKKKGNKNKKKKRVGQIGKYGEWITEDGLKRIESWARDGLTEKDIAEKKIGVTERTFTNWKKKYPSIVSSLKRGKRPVDMEVESQLLKNAMGFEYEETETYIDERADGTQIRKVKKVKKFMKPDTTAQIFWLKNRKPNYWRDKQDLTHEGEIEVKNSFEELSDEELKKLAHDYNVDY